MISITYIDQIYTYAKKYHSWELLRARILIDHHKMHTHFYYSTSNLASDFDIYKCE